MSSCVTDDSEGCSGRYRTRRALKLTRVTLAVGPAFQPGLAQMQQLQPTQSPTAGVDDDPVSTDVDVSSPVPIETHSHVHIQVGGGASGGASTAYGHAQRGRGGDADDDAAEASPVADVGLVIDPNDNGDAVEGGGSHQVPLSSSGPGAMPQSVESLHPPHATTYASAIPASAPPPEHPHTNHYLHTHPHGDVSAATPAAAHSANPAYGHGLSPHAELSHVWAADADRDGGASGSASPVSTACVDILPAQLPASEDPEPDLPGAQNEPQQQQGNRRGQTVGRMGGNNAGVGNDAVDYPDGRPPWETVVVNVPVADGAADLASADSHATNVVNAMRRSRDEQLAQSDAQAADGPPPPLLLRIIVFPFALVYLGIRWCVTGSWRIVTVTIPDALGRFGRLVSLALVSVGNAIANVLNFVLFPFVVVYRGVITGVAWLLTPIFNGLAAVVRGLRSVLGAVATAIAAAFQAVVRGFDAYIIQPIAAAFSFIFAGIASGLTAISGFISYVCGGIYARILQPIGRGIAFVYRMITTALVATATAIWTAITTVASSIYAAVALVANAIASVVSSIASAVYRGIAAICSGVYAGVAHVVRGMIAAWRWATACLWTWVFGPLWRGAARVVSFVWHGIKTVAAGVWRGITAVGNAIWMGLSWIGRSAVAAWKWATGCLWTYIFGPAWRGIKALGHGITSGVRFIWNGIHAVITSIATSIWSGVTFVVNAVAGFGRAVGRAVWAGLSAIGRAVWTGLSAVGRAVATVGRTVGRAVWSVLATVGRSVRQVVNLVASSVSSVVRPVTASVRASVRSVVGAARASITSVRAAIRSMVR